MPQRVNYVIQVCVPKTGYELAEKFEGLAEKTGKTTSALIWELIEERMQKEQPQGEAV